MTHGGIVNPYLASFPFTGEQMEARGIARQQPPTTISREMVFLPRDGEELGAET